MGRHSAKFDSDAVEIFVDAMKRVSDLLLYFNVGWELAEVANTVVEEFARLEGENAGLRDELARRPPAPAYIPVAGMIPHQQRPYVTFNATTVCGPAVD